MVGGFLQEFSLSTPEGLALMGLAGRCCAPNIAAKGGDPVLLNL